MLSFQLLENIFNLRSIIRSQKNLYELLHYLSTTNKIAAEATGTALSESISVFDQTLQDNLRASIKIDLKNFSPRQVFNEISVLDQAYKNFASPANDKPQGLASNIAEFLDAYERYFYSQLKEEELINLLRTADILYNSLNAFGMNLLIIENTLRSKSILPSEEQGHLSIILENEFDVSEFARKLTSLHRIYFELCLLADISYADHPLSISKVESGSFWADLLGYPKIIDFIQGLIENGINYMYRNYTREGKIVAIPKKVETLEEVLEFRNKLRKAGLVTKEVDENINKASVKVAQELNHLLIGEPKVILNGKIYSVGAKLAQKFIEESKRYLLPEISSYKDSNNQIID